MSYKQELGHIFTVEIHEAELSERFDNEVTGNKADPYVELQVLDGVKLTPKMTSLAHGSSGDISPLRTSVCRNTLNPVWNERFTIPISNLESDIIQVTLWDRDLLRKDQLIGIYFIKFTYEPFKSVFLEPQEDIITTSNQQRKEVFVDLILGRDRVDYWKQVANYTATQQADAKNTNSRKADVMEYRRTNGNKDVYPPAHITMTFCLEAIRR